METWFQQFPLEKQELLPLFCNYSPPYKDWHKRSDFSQAWCKICPFANYAEWLQYFYTTKIIHTRRVA